MYTFTTSNVQVRTNRGKNFITTNASKSDILTLLISLLADIPERSVINQSSSTQPLVATFSPMTPPDQPATAMPPATCENADHM